MKIHWKKLLQPRIVVSTLLVFALLAVVFSISNIYQVFDLIIQIRWTSLFGIGMLVISYLVLKGYTLSMMLERLAIRPGWRPLALSFVLGELNVSLPFGIYLQNYVMRRLNVASFARSAAATTGILAIEAFVTLIVLFIVGVPNWGWLRPVIAGIFIAGILVTLLLLINRPLLHRIAAWLTHGRWQGVGRGLVQLVTGLASLVEPQLLGKAILLTAGYLLALAAGLMFVAEDMHIAHVSFVSAMSIYFFSLSVVLLAGGLAPHIGTMEITGISAAEAWGLSATEGLAIMLGLRLIWTAMTWLIGSIVVWLLREEFERMDEEPAQGCVIHGSARDDSQR